MQNQVMFYVCMDGMYAPWTQVGGRRGGGGFYSSKHSFFLLDSSFFWYYSIKQVLL